MINESFWKKRQWIELHLHLDGSLSIKSARELAVLSKAPLPGSDEALRQMLCAPENCRNLNDYLSRFSFPCSLLQTKESITLAVRNLIGELYAEGHVYCEIRFAPQKHCEKGLSQYQAVEAAIEGMADSPMPCQLILCCMRDDLSGQKNYETVDVAARFLNRGVCAVDLAGDESRFSNINFCNLFEYAKKSGVPYVIHAGEADGPESVEQAIDIGAKRIGHGVRSAEDEQLVHALAKKEIPLELCPTSNLQTNVFHAAADFPIRTFLEHGVPVTVNSDNRSVSNTTVIREFQLLERYCGLTEDEIVQMLKTAVSVSFAPQDVKLRLLEQIEHS